MIDKRSVGLFDDCKLSPQLIFCLLERLGKDQTSRWHLTLEASVTETMSLHILKTSGIAEIGSVFVKAARALVIEAAAAN